MENKMTPKQALTNIAIAMVENFVGKDEPRRTEQINRFLNSNECQTIEQALTEFEETKVLCESLKKDINRLNEQCTNLHLKDKKQTQILKLLSKYMEVSNEPYANYENITLLLTIINFGVFKKDFKIIKEWLNNGTK